jgi:uncharacterized protein YlxP (DUF503 family)
MFSNFKVTFAIPGAASLKEKRMVVKSVKERCKSKFNVSVAECGQQDKWQLCDMCFSVAAASQSAAEQCAQDIIDYLYRDDRIEISDIERY